jgi:hypothetical protein
MKVVVIFDYVTGKEDKKKLLTNDASKAMVAKRRKRLEKIIAKRNYGERREDMVRVSQSVWAPRRLILREGNLKNARERAMFSSSEMSTRGGALTFQAEDSLNAKEILEEIVNKMGNHLLKNIQLFGLEAS